MENFLNLLMPPKCLFCESIGSIFCLGCLHKCTLLSFTSPKLISFFSYTGLVRDCIKKSKYSSRQFAALKILTRYGVTRFAGHHLDHLYKNHTLIPIPLNKAKSKQRGFNQAELISIELAKVFRLQVNSKILVRSKDTESQHGLSRKQRFNNLSGAFSVTKGTIPARILLVDDICTSGATFQAATKALLVAGAAEVNCFSLARTPSKIPQYEVIC